MANTRNSLSQGFSCRIMRSTGPCIKASQRGHIAVSIADMFRFTVLLGLVTALAIGATPLISEAELAKRQDQETEYARCDFVLRTRSDQDILDLDLLKEIEGGLSFSC